jgi:hypothetical protein
MREEFRIETPERHQKSLERVKALVQGRNVGVIMTYRGEYTQDDNAGRNLSQEHRFGRIQIRGHYVEVDKQGTKHHLSEHGYLLINKDSEDSGNLKGYLREQGRKYGLPYIIYKPYNSGTAFLISTAVGDKSKLDIGKFQPGWVSEYAALLTGQDVRVMMFEEFNYYRFRSFFNRWGGLFL